VGIPHPAPAPEAPFPAPVVSTSPCPVIQVPVFHLFMFFSFFFLTTSPCPSSSVVVEPKAKMSKNKGMGSTHQSADEIARHNATIIGAAPAGAAASTKSSSKSSSSSSAGGKKSAGKGGHDKIPASVDKHLLANLREMGFNERQASDSLLKHQNSFDEALNELSQLAAKEAAEKAVVAEKSKKGAVGGGSGAPVAASQPSKADAEVTVVSLIDMGFDPQLVREAVAVKWTFDASLEYILEKEKQRKKPAQ